MIEPNVVSSADNSKYLVLFLQSSQDIIRELNDRALHIESSRFSRESLDEVYRLLHTLKGNASFLGLSSLKALLHDIEGLIAAIKNAPAGRDAAFIDFLWQGITLLTAHVELIKATGIQYTEPDGQDAFLRKLRGYLQPGGKGEAVADPATVRQDDTERYYYQGSDISRSVFIIQAYLKQAREGKATREAGERFIQVLQVLAEVFREKSDLDKVRLCNQMIADFESLIDDSGSPASFLLGRLEQLFRDVSAFIEKRSVNSGVQAPEAARSAADGADKEVTYRIEESRINDLYAEVNKLDNISQSLHQLRERLLSAQIPADAYQHLLEVISRFESARNYLFQLVVKVKLVSPHAFCEKTRRMVEELAVACGKKVRINAQCSQAMVERSLIEILERIFIHIVRNCVDHGIEYPEERTAQGKPQEGTIEILLREEKDMYVVTVSDDGYGVDSNALRQAAFQRGFITYEQSLSLKDDEAVNLLFHPGVTTKNSISDVSGRGVGMDVVADAVRKIGGEITARSEQGKGTVIEMRLPVNINK